MSSDPTTQDLIEAARDWPPVTPRDLMDALADRLEEVEEERRSKKALAWWCGPLPDEQGDYTGAPLLTTEEWLAEDAARRGRQVIPLRPVSASPEPSGPDPDTNDVPEHAESVDPEPRHSPWCDGGCGEDGLSSISSDYCPEARKRLGSEPEDDPWDDPWETIETWAKEGITTALTLLDLRKRVETGRRNGDSVARTVNAAWRQIAALEDRLTTLEGHADRGAEAKAELRGRIEELETEVAVARHMRLQMLGRLSELADGEGV